MVTYCDVCITVSQVNAQVQLKFVFFSITLWKLLGNNVPITFSNQEFCHLIVSAVEVLPI
jgi:hypothetical protein